MFLSALFTLAGLASLTTAGYVLEDDYESNSFFSMFDFFTGGDPTHGFVTYVDQATAQNDGLVGVQNGAVYMGVDHTNVASGAGRASVRLTSEKSYNHGLVILDLVHMPGGICGTWPAFWLVGPNWPHDGEIDIIEGVNSQTSNDMTLHTGPGCSISNDGMFSGTMTTPNCYVNAPGQSKNAGCQISATNPQSYGAGFNANGGGVYATEWTSQSINIYFFPRASIPSDISSGNPDPSTWGTALASFSGGVNMNSFFKDQQIVFDMTFCGDWAGNMWSKDAVCGSQAPSCQSFVQNNPSAFTDAYWLVNSLKVYQSNEQASTTSSWTSPPASSVIKVPAASASGWPASQPSSNHQSTVSALRQSFFSGATSAPAGAEALAVTTASTPAPVQTPTTMLISTSTTEQPQAETLSALHVGEFGISKGKAKKQDHHQRQVRHLLDHQRRKRGF